MQMLEVQIALEDLRKARERWGRARTEFFSGYDWVLTRLVHEAARNFMGAAQIADALGVGQSTVRAKMRAIGLDPRAGKRALNKTASQALLENSAIMGIEPHEMDLTSPLAYLPMGQQMRQDYQDKTLARVTELPEQTMCECPKPDRSGSLNDGVEICMRCGYQTKHNRLELLVHDLHLRGGRLRDDQTCPVCSLTGAGVSGNAGYTEAKGQFLSSLQVGIAAEEDWDGPSIKPGDLTNEQVDWLASWLAGEGFVKSAWTRKP